MPYEKLLRDKNIIREVIRKIEALEIGRQLNLMEVCGTHTYTFFRFGLRKIIPSNINLISGPGCPVCITEDTFIDKAIALCQDKNNVISTFGDLIRVRGSATSLEEERARGANVIIVYSPTEALDFAINNHKKRVIFLGVGFETTTPLIASVVKRAKELKIKNFFLLSSHRLIPPALETLCGDREMNIDGFLCPGHVSVIIGEGPYQPIVTKFKKGCVICGFEPLDMVLSIYMLAAQIKENKPKLENEYKRVVKSEGNPIARKLIHEVFKVEDASWRGFGLIEKSGLILNEEYKEFDAQTMIKKPMPAKRREITGCLCADVVKGKIKPWQCPQFKKKCSPDNPLGPCMVSFEGSCKIYYEYSG